MDDLRSRSFHKRFMILWRAYHNRQSLELKSYGRVNDYDQSFKESLLTQELSEGKWYKPRSEKVQRGFIPVYVGSEGTRFVIPMAFLSTPDFRQLMESTADEFGFEQQGGLKIACEEDDFEEILLKCLACQKAIIKTSRK